MSSHRLATVLLCAFFALSTEAQVIRMPTNNAVKVITKWNTSKGIAKTTTSETDTTAAYYWAGFTHGIKQGLLDSLSSVGAEIKGFAGKYDGGCVYRIGVNGRYGEVINVLHQSSYFLNVVPVTVEDKVSRNVFLNENLHYVDTDHRAIVAEVWLNSRISRNHAALLYADYVDSIIDDNESEYSDRYRVIARQERLLRLAELTIVSQIFEYREPKPTSLYARQLLKIDSLWTDPMPLEYPPTPGWLSGYPYTGDSIFVCNNEAQPTSSGSRHLDFCEYDGDTIFRGTTTVNKTIRDITWGFSGHGTHTMGIICGNGWASPNNSRYFADGDTAQWRGVAPKARIMLTPNNGDVNNYSFGPDLSGGYESESQKHDEATSHHYFSFDPAWNKTRILSAGNQGRGAEYGQQCGYYAILQTSKNGTVVGACEKSRPLISYFSSLGPTRDGRIKPDVMAPGSGQMDATNHIELDSLALVNNGVKHSWGFGDGQPGWGFDNFDKNGISGLNQANGILSFNCLTAGYLASDSIFKAGDTVVSAYGDTLVLRIKVTGASQHKMTMALYWKRPRDHYLKGGGIVDTMINGRDTAINKGNNFTSMDLSVQVTGDWVTARIPLDSSWLHYNGHWVTGDTIDRIRLSFGNEKAGIVSCLYADPNDYTSWQGTSMSAPFVTGAAALMLQKYRDDVLYSRNAQFGTHYNIRENPMWNSTVRGILIHTAEDMIDTVGTSVYSSNPDFAMTGHPGAPVYGEGPDWATGWGLVNAKSALEYTTPAHYCENTIEDDSIQTYGFTVPSGTSHLRVTLCWDDPPCDNTFDAYQPKLVNDLDLYLRKVSTGAIVRPWVLDHSMLHNRQDTIPDDGLDSITPNMILSNSAHKGIDSINNVEVVDVESPDAGDWEIVVEGKSIHQNQSILANAPAQDYSLVFDVLPSLQVRPCIDTIIDNCDGTYYAVFGYNNENVATTTISKGSMNHLRYHGQDTAFAVLPDQFCGGRMRNVFKVLFDGSDLTWYLDETNVTARPPLAIIPLKDSTFYNCYTDSFNVIFGYQNPNNFVVVKSPSSTCSNNFRYHGATVNMPGQDSVFIPGVNHKMFTVTFDGSKLAWNLDGDSAFADSGSIPPICLEPLLDTVIDNCDGNYFAYFGYSNPFNNTITVPLGQPENYYNGSSYIAFGLPTTFSPGTHHKVFKIEFDGSPFQWTLNNSLVEATASKATQVCPDFQLYKAFAFGADTFTRKIPNDSTQQYTKIVQNGSNFHYNSSNGYGYTDTTNIDNTLNIANAYDGDDRIYDQYIGQRIRGSSNRYLIFRVDVPDGIYRVVAAGGSANEDGHINRLRIDQKKIIDSLVLNQGSFYRVGFDDKLPPPWDGSGVSPSFNQVTNSPFLEKRDPSFSILQYSPNKTIPGGDLCLLELWRRPLPQKLNQDVNLGPYDSYSFYNGFNLDTFAIWYSSNINGQIKILPGAKPAENTKAIAIWFPDTSKGIRALFSSMPQALIYNPSKVNNNERVKILHTVDTISQALVVNVLNVTVILPDSINLALTGNNACLYLGHTGRILGIDSATIIPKIVLYDSLGNALGLFANLDQAMGFAETSDRIFVDNQYLSIQKAVKWALPFNAFPGSYGMPALSEDTATLYFGAQDSFLYAVNTNGNLKWQQKLDNRIMGSPSTIGNRVFVGTANSAGGRPEETWAKFYRIIDSASAPQVALQYPIHLGMTCTPAIDKVNGQVIFGSLNDTIYAFPFDSSAARRRFATAEQCYPYEGSTGWICVSGVPTSSAISGSIVYTATKAGDLFALNTADLTQVFRKTLTPGAGNCGAPTIDNGAVYLDMSYAEWGAPQTEKYLYRISPVGDIMDSAQHNGVFNQDPGVVVHSGRIYTKRSSGTNQGDDTIVELQRDTLNQSLTMTWFYTHPGLRVETSAVIGKDSCLYVPTGNGMLLKLKIGMSNGPSSDHRYIPLPRKRAGSPIMAPDGTIYMLCSNPSSTHDTSYLVAVTTTSLGMVSSWPSGHSDAQNSGFIPADAPPDLAYKGVGSVTGASYQWNQGNTQFTMCGAGTDIWDHSDGFEYAYEFMTGDFEAITKIDSIDNTNGWAKAGIMARVNLLNNAVHGSILVTPTNGAAFQYRQTTADVTQHVGITGYCPGSTWLKLKRIDSTLYGAVSHDGMSWVQVGSMQIGGRGIFVGLVHSSHNAYQSGCATFSNMQFKFLPRIDLSKWSYTTKIRFNTTSSGANVMQSVQTIPILVRLTSSNFNFSEARSDGDDIRFYDPDMAPLSYEIENWDTAANTANIWVKVPQVDGNSDQDYITMYWGNAQEQSESDGSAVFGTAQGYKAVYHLTEDQAGRPHSGLYHDATGNGYNGDDKVNATDKTGLIGKGQKISQPSSNDVIDVPGIPVATNELTVSLWVKSCSTSNYQGLVTQSDDWAENAGYILMRESNKSFTFRVNNGSVRRVGNSTSKTGFNDNEWYHVVGTYSSSSGKMRIYVNGAAKDSLTISGAIASTSNTLRIGSRLSWADLGMNGWYDEVVVSDAARDPVWVKLTYESQKTGQALVTVEEGQENYAAWQHTKHVHLNTTGTGAGVNDNVTQFPVLVRLTSADFNFAQAQGNGNDIRFSSQAGTRLPYQIERWDSANSLAEIWVKVDTVKGNDNSQYIEMFWGNTQAQCESDGSAVFGAAQGFKAVYHLTENQSGRPHTGLYQDATGNGYSGDDKVTATDKTGLVGLGQKISQPNAEDVIDVPGIPIASNELTVSLWVKPCSTGNYQGLVTQSDDWAENAGFILMRESNQSFTFRVHNGSIRKVGNSTSKTGFNDNEWYHVTGTYSNNSGKMRIYVNGVEMDSLSVSGAITATNNALRIGSRWSWANLGINGWYDEVEVSDAARNPAWVRLSFENQKGNQTLVEYR